VRGARLTLIGTVTGVIGLALFCYEALPTVTGDHILSSTSQLLMWIGFGIIAVGGLLLVLGGWSAASELPDSSADADDVRPQH
jgi:hypothetical protein